MASKKNTTKPATKSKPEPQAEPLVVHMLPAFAQHAMLVISHARTRALNAATTGEAGATDEAEVLGLVGDAIRDAVVARVRGDR